MSQNSYLREFCAQVSQIVILADLTVLRLNTTVYTKMSQKLLSPRVLCTSIKNRVLSWFDRFTAYNKIMSKNITKLISPLFLCTSITNQVLSWFDRFRASYYLLAEMSRNSYLREFCAQVSQIVFQADLTVLSLIRTVWTKMSQNSYLREFCAQVSQIVFFEDLTVLVLFATAIGNLSQNSFLHEFCAQVSQV